MKSKIYAGVIFSLSVLLSLVFLECREYFKDAVYLGLLGLFLVNFISSATFFVSAPTFIAIIAGGSLYSPLLVALVSSVGASLGDLLGFAFGHSGRRLMKKKLDKHKTILFLEKHFHRHGALIIFIFAIIPNPLFDAIGILAGIVNYPLWRFFIIMLIGRFIRYWGLAQAGAYF